MHKSNLPGVLHKSPYQFLLALAVLAVILSSQVQPASSLIVYEVHVPTLSSPRNIDVETGVTNPKVWFTASPVSKGLGAYDNQTNSFTLYPRLQAGSDPWGVTVAPPGTDVWFTDFGTSSIVHLVGNSFVDYNLASGSGPQGITAGTISGNLRIYFTEFTANRIGELDVNTGTIREWQLATGSSPRSIFFESSTRVWFTEFDSNKIGRLDPTGAGTIVEYSLPSGTKPWGIGVDSLGNVWFTENGVGRLGKLSFLAGLAKLEEYTIQLGSVGPREVAVDSFDNVWFTNFDSNTIGKFDRGSGQINLFAIPSTSSRPWGIAVGPNDNIWFGESETTVNRIGRITFSPHFVTVTRTSIPKPTTTTTAASTTQVSTVVNSAVATSSQSAANTIVATGTVSVTATRSETVIVVATVISGQSTFFTATTTVTGATSTTIIQTFTSSVGTTITAGTQTVTVTSTTTHTSTSISTTITGTTLVGTVVVNPPIPGFPIESILAGLVFGLIALLLVRRRRTARSS